MEAYTGFAQVYDTFMDDTPYEEWSRFLPALLQKHRGGGQDSVLSGTVPADGKGTGNHYAIETDDNVIKENLRQEQNTILDLGCGTGSMTESFAARGYDMIGVDNAQEMLEIAVQKREKSGHDILYLLQDMRNFELYGTVRAVLSVCDCINYVMDDKELLQVFRLVNNYLDPSGIFLFDFNTQYKYEHVLGSRTFAESRDECSFIWDNYYDADSRVNEYELTLFIQEEDQEELYRRYQESHYQRGYTSEEIKALIEQAGMEFLAAYDAYTQEPAKACSERILAVAKERGKTL